MSMDPQTMQMILAQRLNSGGQQPPQPPSYGGAAAPQVTGQVAPMNAAAQVAQRLMLMRALQQRPPGTAQPTPQTPASTPQPGMPLPQQ